MDVALLILRLVPGLLLAGHGLQKLVPPDRSPRWLAGGGPAKTAAGLRRGGLEPAIPLALLVGSSELGGGLLLATGLLTRPERRSSRRRCRS